MMSLVTLFAAEGGFAINLNPLETNLINLVIVIGLLVYFLKGLLGGILERRRESILKELTDAENRLKTATTELSKAQADLGSAKEKAMSQVQEAAVAQVDAEEADRHGMRRRGSQGSGDDVSEIMVSDV